MRAAVVGSGPAGFYAAQALLKRFPGVKIDIIERLAVPFGLVRYGVAPDHPATKNVISQFSDFVRTNRSQVNFYGNVPITETGSLTPALLNSLYNITIYATGAKGPRQLTDVNIPDRCVYSAHDFIMWMNGHPDYHAEGKHAIRMKKMSEDLCVQGDHIGVVGVGNVAIDIARLMLRSKKELKMTDISSSALEVLQSCNVGKVSLIGRRSAQHAAWTTAALREVVTKIPGITTYADHGIIERDLQTKDLSRQRQRTLKLLMEKTKHLDVSKGLDQQISRVGSQLFLRFLRAPQQIIPSDAGIDVQFSVASSEKESEMLKFKSMFLSIGYQPGIDGDKHRVGWANKDARGIIGDNKWDAETVVASMETPDAKATPGLEPWIQDTSAQIVSWEGWERINAEERRRGIEFGRTEGRVKLESTADMLDVALSPSVGTNTVTITNPVKENTHMSKEQKVK